MEKMKILSPELVEKGTVLKREIAVLGDYEIGILMVHPHSKIKKHDHIDNWEIYVDIPYGFIIDVCEIGNSHDFDNDSDNPRDILYIKGYNGVPIPNEKEISSFIS